MPMLDTISMDSDSGAWALVKGALCNCSVGRLIKVVDVLCLLCVLVMQGSTLNFYLIQHMEGSNAWYFWFLADFLVLIAMMTAVFLARKHYAAVATNPEGVEAMPVGSVLGRFPLCYSSWFIYSLLLVAKVILLFRMNIAQDLPDELWYGSQFLKVVIGSSSVVFVLLVDSHHDAVADSPQQIYLQSLVAVTTFEVLDSVTFLGLLFPRATHLILTYPLENTILALTCINFVLPTLALFKLSQCEFGTKSRPLGLKIIYRVLHLAMINAPYFGIRMYLWGFFNHDVSIFILKNVIVIFVHMRALVPECILWFQLLREVQHGKFLQATKKALSGRASPDDLELKVMYNDDDENNLQRNLNNRRTQHLLENHDNRA